MPPKVEIVSCLPLSTLLRIVMFFLRIRCQIERLLASVMCLDDLKTYAMLRVKHKWAVFLARHYRNMYCKQ